MNCAASVKTLPPKGSTDVGWSRLRMAREVTESLLLIIIIIIIIVVMHTSGSVLETFPKSIPMPGVEPGPSG